MAYFSFKLLQEMNPPFLTKLLYKFNIFLYILEICGKCFHNCELLFCKVATLSLEVFEFDTSPFIYGFLLVYSIFLLVEGLDFLDLVFGYITVCCDLIFGHIRLFYMEKYKRITIISFRSSLISYLTLLFIQEHQ